MLIEIVVGIACFTLGYKSRQIKQTFLQSEQPKSLLSRDEMRLMILKEIKSFTVYRDDNDFEPDELLELELMIDEGLISFNKRTKELYLTQVGNDKVELSLELKRF